MKEEINDIYPMPSFVRQLVRDVAHVRDWYIRLGFREIYKLELPGGGLIMSHLRWAKYADLMIAKAQNAAPLPGESLTLYFTVERGQVDRIATLVPDSVIEGPILQSWNAREVIFRDPAGLRIAFAEQGDQSLSFDEVMENVRTTI